MINNPEARLDAALAKLQALVEKQRAVVKQVATQIDLNLEELANGRKKSKPIRND